MSNQGLSTLVAFLSDHYHPTHLRGWQSYVVFFVAFQERIWLKISKSDKISSLSTKKDQHFIVLIFFVKITKN